MTAAGSGGAREHWRWEERSWRDARVDWRGGKRLAAGVDVGSVSSQAVVLVDGALWAWSSVRTGSSSPGSARRALVEACGEGGPAPGELHAIVGTGYGKGNVELAHATVTEITCHARGARSMYGPSVRTVLDMGGQDCKVIRCDASGAVVRFLMNDRCAAGTGRGMEVIADLLGIPIGEIGPASLDVKEEPPPVSNACVVFARGEALGRMRQGWTRQMVLASYMNATVKRVLQLVGRVGLERDFVITGGIAKNAGIVRRLERELGLQVPASPLDTQIAGALGAALIAHERGDT